MAKGIKIRAQAKKGVTTVKALMSHPMHTGLQKNKKTGKNIPAHFIQEVKCEHNGSVMMTALWGPAVSKNPYLSFKFKGGAQGDSIKVSWVDNKGESSSQDAKIR